MNERANLLYEFGPFRLEPAEPILLRNGQAVRLTPKSLQVLTVLVRNRGKVVSKQELLREVWPDIYVEEANLTQNVHTLRKILGDAEGQNRYIETVPRHGYRFVAPLREIQGALPWFQRLTFRRGSVQAARFAPGSKTIVYGAAWEGWPIEIYMARSGNAESRPLGYQGAGLLSVSESGRVALSLGRELLRGFVSRGTLAVASIDGGQPRALLEDVQWADWSPDGSGLAVVREVGGRARLEYPAGKVLYETGGWISYPRFSPGGETIAFLDHPGHNDDAGSVAIVDARGGKKVLSGGWVSVQGLAWGPDGNEIWFTAARAGNARALRAVKPAGEERVIERAPGTLTLHDVSRDGRVLLTRNDTRLGISCLTLDAEAERDLSWHDWSLTRDLSDDGSTILFTESGEAGGTSYGVYIRRTDGSPALRLGDGSALAFPSSPAPAWALAKTSETQPRLVLLPTGPGEPQMLERASMSYQQWAAFFPDGRRVLFTGNEPGKGSRLYVQEIAGGRPRTITPDTEGVYLSAPRAISPDGLRAAAMGPDHLAYLFPLGGAGQPRRAPGVEEGELVVRWASDGGSLYVFRRGRVPARIYRVHLSDGRREFWRETTLPDPAGVHEIVRLVLTPDGASYAYTYTRDLSDLYQIEGLQ